MCPVKEEIVAASKSKQHQNVQIHFQFTGHKIQVSIEVSIESQRYREKRSSKKIDADSWKRLLLTTTVDDKVSVRAIAKTFASGKTEKLVYESLAELDLPSGKVTINQP